MNPEPPPFSEELRLVVNGRELVARNVDPHTTLLSFLRDSGLPGSKEGCAEGECGACAVAVRDPDTGTFRAVNACLLPLPALHGREVVTVEGVGTPEAPHPVQVALTRGGSQCGYCTPGFVVSLFCEYHRPGRTEMREEAIEGNLCRCTGYRPIREALNEIGEGASLPRAAAAVPPASVSYRANGRAFFRPTSLAELTGLLAEHPAAKIVAGGTDVFVEANLRGVRWDTFVSVEAVPELRVLNDGDVLEIGAAVPLSDLASTFEGRSDLLDALWPLFASPLVRARATLGGNLATASPVGDAAPCLLALDAAVNLASAEGARRVPLADFFLGYRLSALRPGEVLTSVEIPKPLPDASRFYKIAKRGRDDISTVAVAAALSFEAGRVVAVRLGLGGVAATPARAPLTEAFLTGRPFTEDTAVAAGNVLAREFAPLSDQRGSAAYRTGVLRLALSRLHADLHPESPEVVA